MKRYLESVVSRLADEIGVRSWRDTDHLARAADFISGQFSSFGYAVAEQAFPYGGNLYRNVAAELRGAVEPERILVVGAHYDTVSTTPGADDNASGIAGLLGLARSLSGTRLAKTVRFVAFPLEEQPTYRSPDMGSYQYAKGLKEAGAVVDGMICLEMIGYFSDKPGSQSYPLPLFKLKYPSTGNYIAMVGNVRSRSFTGHIACGFQKGTGIPVITLNAPAVVVGIDFSDHWSFHKFGYNALMITDTAFYRNPHYHRSSDLPETLDYGRMAEVVAGLAAAVGEWGER